MSCLQEFLTSKAVRAALNQTGSALAALTVLKKICDHPCLLADQQHPTGGLITAANPRCFRKDDRLRQIQMLLQIDQLLSMSLLL